MDIPTHEKPLAVSGLISYRYEGIFGYIMIGAKNDQEALREADRSLHRKGAVLSKLERYDYNQNKYLFVGGQND